MPAREPAVTTFKGIGCSNGFCQHPLGVVGLRLGAQARLIVSGLSATYVTHCIGER